MGIPGFARRALAASIHLVALAATSVMTIGCGARAVTPAMPSLRVADADLDRDPEPVDANGALADLEVATRVFDEAYAGIDGRRRTPRADALRDARARLAARTRWEPAELAEELRSIFRQPDGHLTFGYDGRAPLHLPAWPHRRARVTAPLIDRVDAAGGVWLEGGLHAILCPDDDRVEQVLVPTTSGRFVLGLFDRDSPLAATAAHARACLARPTGDERAAPLELLLRATRLRPGAPAAARDAAPVGFEGGEVPILTIRTFDNGAKAALEELPHYAERLRAAPAFIVDARGNGGGNFRHAEAFILALTDATLQSLDERDVWSMAAAEGRANRVRRRLAMGVPASAIPAFEEHLALLDEEIADIRKDGRKRLEIYTRGATVKGRAKGPLRSRAVFLVDQGCASACEMMLALARQIPGVVIAGENTRGGMAVGELALFRLPRSGVTISFGTRAFRDPRGGFEETRGYIPDLWIDGADPLEDARRIARRDAAGSEAERLARAAHP